MNSATTAMMRTEDVTPIGELFPAPMAQQVVIDTDHYTPIVTEVVELSVKTENRKALIAHVTHWHEHTFRFLPGFLAVSVHVNTHNLHTREDDRRVLLYVQWQSVEAILAASKNPSLSLYFEGLGKLLSSPPDVRIYTVEKVLCV